MFLVHLDGFLLDAEKTTLASLQRVMARYKANYMDRADLKQLLVEPEKAILRKQVGVLSAKRAYEMYFSYLKEGLQKVFPHPGAMAFLNSLIASGDSLYLFSLRNRHVVGHMVLRYGWSDLFDGFFTGEDVELPQHSGIELTRVYERLAAETKVYFLTAQADFSVPHSFEKIVIQPDLLQTLSFGLYPILEGDQSVGSFEMG